MMWYHRLLMHQTRNQKLKSGGKGSKCAPNGSVKLANNFSGIFRGGIVIIWYLHSHMLIFGEKLFLLLFCFFRNDSMFTLVCKFEIQFEEEIL